MERNDLSRLVANIPDNLYDIVKKKATELKLPIGRIVAYALDNELDAANPFDYPLVEPETVFVEYAYIEEAQKIYNFLRKYPEGMDRGNIMLMRHIIGIPNKATVMLALRELLNSGMAIESKVAPKGKYFQSLHPDLIWIRIAQNIEQIEKNKKALEAKAAKLQQKIDRLEHKQAMVKPMEKDNE